MIFLLSLYMFKTLVFLRRKLTMSCCSLQSIIYAQHYEIYLNAFKNVKNKCLSCIFSTLRISSYFQI